ncbi:unnamed protein product [Arabis nemorensis]|uniref:Uncharacterized protein n=1 Tax=Arabis nemorensis TaxID=586526 RepID=A0A565CT48_9BRAS|nr:unnamed protein product [Arabis nemorensis]
MEEYKVTCGSFDIAVRVASRTFWDISKIGPTRRLIRCTAWQPLMIVPPSALESGCEDYNTLNSCATCLFWWRRPWWPPGMFLPPKRMRGCPACVRLPPCSKCSRWWEQK